MTLLVPQPVPFPAESRMAGTYASPNLCDAYAIDLPAGATRDPQVLARFVFSQRPRWVAALMRVRDAMVGGLGLKTERRLHRTPVPGGRIGIFRVYETTGSEVVMGEDDRHLDFRASILVRPATGAPASAASVVLSTVVHCHNVTGRTYLRVIAPFHRLIAQAFLRRAAKVGWPQADGSGPSSC